VNLGLSRIEGKLFDVVVVHVRIVP
jgi:hypothetical protein